MAARLPRTKLSKFPHSRSTMRVKRDHRSLIAFQSTLTIYAWLRIIVISNQKLTAMSVDFTTARKNTPEQNPAR